AEVDETELREVRERLDNQLSRIVEEWARQSERTFDERRDEQLKAFGPSYIGEPAGSEFFGLMWSAMDERDVPVARRRATVNEFLRSEAPAQIRAAQLRAGFLAAIGWSAARGQLGRVTASLRWDLQSISAYAPYVDAMFVDRQCHRLMRDTQLAEAIPAELAVFSVENLGAFEHWLDEVEASAPAGHFEVLDEMYGPSWLHTYNRLLEPPRDAGGEG
ncbi:MAG: hypothetical protein ACXU9S_16365, partial [Gemmatimonadaceae bacterium]